MKAKIKNYGFYSSVVMNKKLFIFLIIVFLIFISFIVYNLTYKFGYLERPETELFLETSEFILLDEFFQGNIA